MFETRTLAHGLAALVAWGAAPLAFSATTYTVEWVPTLGGDRNYANDISDTGLVTGNSRKENDSKLYPYVWQSGAAVEIPLLPDVPTFGRGFSVNNQGTVVGESGNGPSKAFAYNHNDATLSDLGGLAGGPLTGVANGINNLGQVVGASSNGQTVRAFLSDGTPGGSIIDLGTPMGGTNSSARAYAISDTGIVAGTARNIIDTTSEPTLWLPQANGTYLPTTIATPAGHVYGAAEDVNDAGHAVGFYSDPVTGDTRAFLYNGTTNVDLPIFDERPALDNARALGINGDGLVVGMVSDFDNAPTFGQGGVAVVWEDGQVFDLNTMIPEDSGWTLLSATAINSQGQIVGYGSYEGDTRAFVLTPVPEPASLFGLSAVAGAGLLRRRRRA